MLIILSKSPKLCLQTAAFVQKNSPTPTLFTLMNDKEKQQILTFKKLEAVNVWHVWMTNDWKESLITKGKNDLFFSPSSSSSF